MWKLAICTNALLVLVFFKWDLFWSTTRCFSWKFKNHFFFFLSSSLKPLVYPSHVLQVTFRKDQTTMSNQFKAFKIRHPIYSTCAVIIWFLLLLTTQLVNRITITHVNPLQSLTGKHDELTPLSFFLTLVLKNKEPISFITFPNIFIKTILRCGQPI